MYKHYNLSPTGCISINGGIVSTKKTTFYNRNYYTVLCLFYSFSHKNILVYNIRSLNSIKPERKRKSKSKKHQQSRIPVRSGRSSPRYPDHDPIHFPPIHSARYWSLVCPLCTVRLILGMIFSTYIYSRVHKKATIRGKILTLDQYQSSATLRKDPV